MLIDALLTARDLGRMAEIAAILIRHGLGDMVRRLGLADALERAGHRLRWEHAADLARLPPAVQLRRALEELGPTFVKLGQILAGRADLLPPDYIRELEQLHSRVPPLPLVELLPSLRAALGGDPAEVFARFDEVPLAAASIAQVHRAQLHDGTEVVVKIRRPGITEVIEADLRLLERLAALAERQMPALAPYRPQLVVREFGRSLRRELDLAGECRNAERMAANMAALAFVSIPAVHWALTSERVNVQDFIAGVPGDQLQQPGRAARPEAAAADAAITPPGAAPAAAPAAAAAADDPANTPAAPAAADPAADLDKALLARRGAQAVLKMIVEDGFFHADPHPGNVFYLPGNRIGFIDFGMVGRLSTRRREELLNLLLGLVQREPQRVADVLMDWAGDTSGVHIGPLEAEIEDFVDQYHGTPLAQLDLARMLSDVTAILRAHRLALPADLALLIKTFITLEGMGRTLDPDFHMTTEALPMLQRTMRARYQPQALARRSGQSLWQMVQTLERLPGDVSRLLRNARRGHLSVGIEVQHLRQVGSQLDRAMSRLSVALVIAALIIGSSIAMTVQGGPTLWGLPAFGLLGYIGAVFGALWLLRAISRDARSSPGD